MKIAFLGYDFFYGVIEKLVQTGHEFNWLFTYPCDGAVNFNDRVMALAQQQNAVISQTRLTAADIEKLQAEGCDIILSAAYRYRIPVSPEMPRCVNIHPTLLPDGRGPWPLPVTILKNLPASGVTLHRIDVDFDSGDILLQKEFALQPDENLETLSCKVQMAAADLTLQFLQNPDYYWQNATPQNSKGPGSYWAAPTFADRELQWQMPVHEIDRIARAFGKFDSLANFDGKDWVCQDISVWQEAHGLPPGTVAHKTNREYIIAAKDGFVCIRFFQPDPDTV